MVIRNDGTFEESFRTYRICGQDPAPCDPQEGDGIGSGGHVTGHIVAGSTPSWSAVVDTTTDPEVEPRGSATFTYDRANHAVVISQGPTHETSYCSEQSPEGHCGA
jgi:hypothetical protein